MIEICVPTGDLSSAIEMLAFVAELCADQAEILDKALCESCSPGTYTAAELAADTHSAAGRLARHLPVSAAFLEPCS